MISLSPKIRKDFSISLFLCSSPELKIFSAVARNNCRARALSSSGMFLIVTFRKEFRTEGCTAHIRKRKSGKTHWNYEVRYRRHGYNISASANNLEEAKMKFLVKLKEAEKTGRKAPVKKPTSKKLGEFADYIFETYYKRKVTAETYKNNLNRYRKHIEPIFGNREDHACRLSSPHRRH